MSRNFGGEPVKPAGPCRRRRGSNEVADYSWCMACGFGARRGDLACRRLDCPVPGRSRAAGQRRADYVARHSAALKIYRVELSQGADAAGGNRQSHRPDPRITRGQALRHRTERRGREQCLCQRGKPHGSGQSKAQPDTRQRRRERGHAQAAAEGADCLEQSGARTLQGQPGNPRHRRRGGAQAASARPAKPNRLRIHDAPDHSRGAARLAVYRL